MCGWLIGSRAPRRAIGSVSVPHSSRLRVCPATHQVGERLLGLVLHRRIDGLLNELREAMRVQVLLIGKAGGAGKGGWVEGVRRGMRRAERLRRTWRGAHGAFEPPTHCCKGGKGGREFLKGIPGARPGGNPPPDRT